MVYIGGGFTFLFIWFTDLLFVIVLSSIAIFSLSANCWNRLVLRSSSMRVLSGLTGLEIFLGASQLAVSKEGTSSGLEDVKGADRGACDLGLRAKLKLWILGHV